MSIAPGTRLGPYEITGTVGAGGMGEVYKAKDTRLERTVAVKVLPEPLANDAERRQRFEQEARAVSSLNHPHICTLHDIGRENGVDFLVMEYLEGETLADRLERGALALDEAVAIGVQMADALDRAHRQGIVHRDLKPGNVMLTKRGVKLLDFGVAKLLETSPVSSETEQPTRPKPLTGAGALIGTVQYMAPEQLEGKDVDARSDIFSFGAVLYEMLTGQKAFPGESQASVIGAILKDDPAPMRLEPTPPPGLERIVRKCLAKDPDERWYAAHDLMDALKWSVEEEPSEIKRERPTSRFAAVAAFVAGIVLTALGFLLLPSGSRNSDAVSRYEITLPPETFITDFYGGYPLAMSPDGRRLVYAAGDELGEQRLYVRDRDAFESSVLPGTENAHTPVFSPDGESVAYFASGKLWKIGLAGGAPRALCDVPTANFARGASWGTDGSIVFTSGAASGLYRVSSDGGEVETLLDGGAVASPQILPEDDAILFIAFSGEGSARHSHLLFPSTGETRRLDELGEMSWARYLPTGHLVYHQEDSLTAVRFDPRTPGSVGKPVTLQRGPISGTAISGTGTLAYVSGSSSFTGSVAIVDRSGEVLRSLGKGVGFAYPRFSPSGQQISATTVGETGDVVVFDLDRGSSTRATFRGTSDHVWTPDGTAVTFASEGAVTSDLFHRRLGESEPATLLLKHENPLYPHSYSPKGELAFYEVHPETARDIWILPADGGPRQPFLVTEFNERAPAFSPDGGFIAYVSDESGRDEVYVQPYPPTGERWIVSTGGGTEPTWTRGGRELTYRHRNEVLSVTVTLEPTFKLSSPQVLFTGRYLTSRATSGSVYYDVSPDGERFAMIRPDPESELTKIQIVLNWHEELERLVP